MTLVDAVALAVRTLRKSPLRSLLTMLGIVLGVASVLDVFAIGAGAQDRVAAQIRAVGSDVIMIAPGASVKSGVRLKAGTATTLTEDDIAAVAAEASGVETAAGSLSGNSQLVRHARNWNTTVNGTTAAHFAVRDWGLERGRLFSRSEEEGAAKVAVLGSATAKALFVSNEDPIYATVRIMDVPFTVIGVLQPKSAEQDDVAFVPLRTAKLRFLGSASGVDRRAVAYGIVKAKAEADLGRVKADIETVLRRRHHIAAGRDDDFKVTEAAAMLGAQAGASGTVALLLLAIATVSLVVGGTSIMNMMVVSVAERTREIGLRRAVGARSRDILVQFLVEGLALCGAGNAAGVVVGCAAAWLLAQATGWPISLQPQVLILAVGFSIATSVVFIFYPALRAARLSPVEALKAD